MPHGEEPDGVIDLGIRIRDQLLRGEVVGGGVRQVLADRLGVVARSGRLAMSPGLVESVLHTWPLEAMLDGAVATWREGPDPYALSVITRAMNVVSNALGWPMTVDRVWPMPDPEWIEREVGEGPFVVHPRGPRDGAPAVASVLNAPLGEKWPVDLPPLLRGQGDELATRIEEWLPQIESGEYAAIHFETPVPWDADSQAALARLRETTPAQLALARYGHAGLICPDVVDFDEHLGTAPAGEQGDMPRALCDALILPHVGEGGRTSLAGALCWRAPYNPVLVHPFAVEVFQRFDGKTSIEDVARSLETAPDVIQSVSRQLTEIGALTA